MADPMADRIKAAIRELEARRYRAMIEADTAALETLLADTLVYTHSNATTDGKASYIAGVRSKKVDSSNASTRSWSRAMA